MAVRYLCANTHPDHDSIRAFRTANAAAFRAAFVSVVQLAQHLRLTLVGTVSVDGTRGKNHAGRIRLRPARPPIRKPNSTSSIRSAALSIVAKVRAVRTGASGSLSAVRNGGEGRGEEALCHGGTARKGGAPLSPFGPHGAREPDALLVAALSA